MTMMAGSMMIKLPYLSSLLILGMVLMVLQQSQHPRQGNQLMSDSEMLTEVYSGQLDLDLVRLVNEMHSEAQAGLPDNRTRRTLERSGDEKITNHPDEEKVQTSDREIETLANILEAKVAQGDITEGVVANRTCSLLASMGNVRGTCVDTSCPRNFSASAKIRIRELLSPPFQLTSKQHRAIAAIADGVPERKFLFVTAASSNHYKESQALVYNLKNFVFNHLHPSSYAFIYFDIGLSTGQRSRVVKNCNCTVKSISFEAFPRHVRIPNCYAWKTLIIKALLKKSEVLIYMDTSIRFKATDMDKFVIPVQKWGMQFMFNPDSIPNHTLESMFTFYGDLPCMYAQFPELLAGFSVFHNETFIDKVVLDPWVACALNKSCMCPVDGNSVRGCPHKERKVGQCHRFDLSSITLVLAKLYGDKLGQLVFKPRSGPGIRRHEEMDFFKD